MKADRRKNMLDERQEQKLLQIEGRCFWLLYVLLAVEMLVKIVVFRSRTAVIGEMICFMIVSTVMVALCLHNGIWDRHMSARPKTYAAAALAAGVIAGIVNGVMGAMAKVPLRKVFIVSGSIAALTFILTFTLLWYFGYRYHKRCESLERKADEDDEDDD